MICLINGMPLKKVKNLYNFSQKILAILLVARKRLTGKNSGERGTKGRESFGAGPGIVLY
jgi:hypothetical protein